MGKKRKKLWLQVIEKPGARQIWRVPLASFISLCIFDAGGDVYHFIFIRCLKELELQIRISMTLL